MECKKETNMSANVTQPLLNFDREQALAYLTCLNPTKRDFPIAWATKDLSQPGNTGFQERKPARNAQALIRAVKKLDLDNLSVFVCPAPRDRGADRRLRGTAAFATWAWIDFDADKSNGNAFPHDLFEDGGCFADVATLVESGTPGNYHVYIHLERRVSASYVTTLNLGLKVWFNADNKWGDESLLRLPGTMNPKNDPPTPCRVIRKATGSISALELLGLIADHTGLTTDELKARTERSSRGSRNIEPIDLSNAQLRRLRQKLPYDVQHQLRLQTVFDGNTSDGLFNIWREMYKAGLSLEEAYTLATHFEPAIERMGHRLSQDIGQAWIEGEATPDRKVKRQIALGVASPAEVAADDDDPLFRLNDPASQLTDLGNALRLHRLFSTRYIHDHTTNTWHVWNGQVWSAQEGQRYLHDDVKTMIRSIADEAAAFRTYEDPSPDDDDFPDRQKAREEQAKKFGRWYQLSQSAQSIGSAKKLFSHEVAVSWDELDAHKELVNLGNKVYNLQTREFLDPDAAFMLTKRMGTTYDPHAKCPNFLKFLDRVLPDPEVQQFLQKLVGATFEGRRGNRHIPIPTGLPGTGKSTLLNILMSVFGDYGAAAARSVFTKARNEAHLAELDALAGKRFVIRGDESNDAKFDAGKVNGLSGGDLQATRVMRGNIRNWVPECTLWLACNEVPQFHGEEALADRLHIILFDQPFTAAEKEHATENLARINNERPGILNWIIEGFIKGQEEGIQRPDKVIRDGNAVLQEQNPLLPFLRDMQARNVFVVKSKDRTLSITNDRLWAQYDRWADSQRLNSSDRLNAHKAAKLFKQLGFQPMKTRTTRGWYGISFPNLEEI